MTGFPSPQPTLQRPNYGNFASYSQLVGTAATQLIPQQVGEVGYVCIANTSPPGGPNLWISRSLGQTIAANAPGTIKLAPGDIQEFRIPAKIPTNATWAIADQAGCAVTAEVA